MQSDFLYKTLDRATVEQYLASKGQLGEGTLRTAVDFCMRIYDAWASGDSGILETAHVGLITNNLSTFVSYATPDQLLASPQMVKFANFVLPVGMREDPSAFISEHSASF